MAAREHPTTRYYWVDPFDADALDPDLIAMVLCYYTFKFFKVGRSLASTLRRIIGIDKYDVKLRLANYATLAPDQLAAIRSSARRRGKFSSVTIEPA